MHKLTEKQKQLADEYCKFALQFAAMISFGPKGEAITNATLNNGTITLVRLGGRNMGITNHHVIQQYRERVIAGENLTCQVGNVTIEPLSCLVSECEKTDLAVLDLNGIDPKKIRGSPTMPCQFHEPTEWPPRIPKIGEFVIFGGFPGTKREEAGRRSFVFGTFSSGSSEVISVQPDVLTCTIALEQCVIAFDYDGKGLEGLPGISGAPVLVQRQLESGFFVFDLVGVVFEYSESFDALRVRPSTLIEENGAICA